MRNFVQIGDIVTVVAPANVASGDGVLVGTLFGIAVTDASSGSPVEIQVTGAFELPKTSAQAWTVGALIYWDGGVATTDDNEGGNALVGKARAIAVNPSGKGVVRLNP